MGEGFPVELMADGLELFRVHAAQFLVFVVDGAEVLLRASSESVFRDTDRMAAGMGFHIIHERADLAAFVPCEVFVPCDEVGTAVIVRLVDTSGEAGQP